MYRLIQSYLDELPGAIKEVELPDESTRSVCVYTPHSLLATGYYRHAVARCKCGH